MPGYTQGFIDNLYRQAEGADVELRPLTERIANDTGGEAGFRPGPKDRTRVRDKVNAYSGDASQLVDLSASKIVYGSVGELYDALPTIERELGDRVVRVKDRLIDVDPKGSGYGDVLMNLKMSNGHMAELRLHLKQVDEVAKFEHALYQVTRSFEAHAKEQNRPMTTNELAIVTAIQHRARELFRDALAEARK